MKVRIAKATSALARLRQIWRDKGISVASKLRLLRALVLSVLLYGAEAWTLNAEVERRINALEIFLTAIDDCYRSIGPHIPEIVIFAHV